MDSRIIKLKKNRNQFYLECSLFLIACIITSASIILWYYSFHNFFKEWLDYARYIQKFYILSIAAYIIITRPNSILIKLFFKSLFKLYLGVSIVSFLFLMQLTSTDSAIIVAYISFFVAYLEVAIEFDIAVSQFILKTFSLRSWTLHFHEIPMPPIIVKSLTIAMLSVLNALLPYLLARAVYTLPI